MWLLFHLLESGNGVFRYAYSRENRNLDGIILYRKDTEELILERPCSADANSRFSQKNAKEAFGTIVREEFPIERMIAYG